MRTQRASPQQKAGQDVIDRFLAAGQLLQTDRCYLLIAHTVQKPLGAAPYISALLERALYSLYPAGRRQHVT